MKPAIKSAIGISGWVIAFGLAAIQLTQNITPQYGELGNLEVRPIQNGMIESKIYLVKSSDLKDEVLPFPVEILAIKNGSLFCRELNSTDKIVYEVDMNNGTVTELLCQ